MQIDIKRLKKSELYSEELCIYLTEDKLTDNFKMKEVFTCEAISDYRICGFVG